MTTIADWKDKEFLNLKIDELPLDVPWGMYTNKIMTAVKKKFDAVDAKLAKVEGALVNRGEKATVSALPVTGNSVGDYWTITADGSEWAWNGTEWYELGNDDAVHKAGTETVTGLKTIHNSVADSPDTYPNSRTSRLLIRMPDANKGSLPEKDQHAGVVILDSELDDVEWLGRLACLEAGLYPNGRQTISLSLFKNELVDGAASRSTASLDVNFAPDGTSYAQAPETPDASSNRRDIVTLGFLIDHYARKRRYNSTPVFSVILAENTAVSVSDPYTIELPSAVPGCLFVMTYPTESSNVGGKVTALHNGQSVAWAGCNIHHNGTALRNYVFFDDINGVFMPLRFYGAQGVTGTVQGGALDSSPTFGNVQIDELRIAPSTDSDTLTAGVSIAVYALEEV